MFDDEGSRSEFLKLLAEFGEEPAFVARARAPQIALEGLLHACEAKREEMLKWPKFYLSMLAGQVRQDWSRLGSLFCEPKSVTILAALHASMPTNLPVPTNWLVSERAALGQFLESAERFNRNWAAFIDGIDLEPINKPRRDFNQFYVLEKACAFGSERVTEGFEPLGMIDSAYLYARFPLLMLPSSRVIASCPLRKHSRCPSGAIHNTFNTNDLRQIQPFKQSPPRPSRHNSAASDLRLAISDPGPDRQLPAARFAHLSPNPLH